ncbi:MAG: DUF2157 domain-containing protein [Actinobacteria bacterium]|jgi:hypothetical protein|nr:DUF2157 domain-containing protein [Actinomycetota bacterium]
MRDTTTTLLQDWHEAGLVTAEQVDAIARFERARTPGPAARRTVVAEAIGYVGAALALGAIALLVGEFWDQFTVAARLALVLVLTVALFGSGTALRHAARQPLQRLASVLYAGTVAGVAWTTGIVAGDVMALRDAEVGLAVGAVSAAAALPLYLLRRRALPQLALLVAVLATALAALSLPNQAPDTEWYSLMVVVIGVAWFLLGAGGWLPPSRVAESVGAVLAVVACQFTGGDGSGLLLLGVALAVGLVVLAIRSDALHLLAVGAVGLFLVVPRLVFTWFGDAIGAPATMLVIGLLLVLLAVGLGRARREIGEGPELQPPAAPTGREVA